MSSKWHPRAMIMSPMYTAAKKSYACMHANSAFRQQQASSSRFWQGQPGYMLTLAPRRTSDSLIAGMRSWPLSFLLLGSKSACAEQQVIGTCHCSTGGRTMEEGQMQCACCSA